MHVFPIVEHYIEHFPKAARGLLEGSSKVFKTSSDKLGDGLTTAARRAKKSTGRLKETVSEFKLTRMKKPISEVGSEVGSVKKSVGEIGSEADSARKLVSEVEPPPYSKIDDATDITKNTEELQKLKDELAEAQKNPSVMKKFLSENYGKIIAGTTLGAIATAAAITADRINKTDYTITSIKKDSTDPSKTIITYKPEDMFTKRDSIMISSSNSDPHIDGEYSIQPLRGGSLRIDKTISKQGNYGIMKCYTTLSNQTTQTITDLTKPVTSTVAGVAGGVVGDIAGDIIPEVFKSMGLGGLGDVPVFSWIACVFCIIILSMLLMLVIVI